MTRNLLQRHASGPFAKRATYVDACNSLDPEALGAEYRSLVAAAPTRTQRYIVDHDIRGRSDNSNRSEELLAHRMFLERTKLLVPGWPGVQVVDFQTPLKSQRSDRLGKVDLLGIGDGLCVIELKVLRRNGGADTPLNAMLEAVGYCAVVEANAARIVSELDEDGHSVGSGAVAALVLAPDDYWAAWDGNDAQPWRVALLHAGHVVGAATGVPVRFGSFVAADVGAKLAVTDPLA